MGRIDSIRRIEADMVEEEQIKEAQQLFVNSPKTGVVCLSFVLYWYTYIYQYMVNVGFRGWYRGQVKVIPISAFRCFT